jgi:hypothetical protein
MIEQVFEDYTELPSLDIIKNFITYYWNGSTSQLAEDGKCSAPHESTRGFGITF